MLNIAPFRFLLIGGCLSALLPAGHAQSLLVVNQGDTDLSIVSPSTLQVTGKIAEGTVGVHAHEVAASRDGRTAYLPIYGSTGVGKPGLDGREMLVVDLATKKIIAHVDFGHGVRPHQPVLDPNTGLLYVTTELDKTVTAIDPKTLKIVGTIPTGQEQSHMLALSSDGARGYTANVGPGTVSVLDMRHRKTVAVIHVAGTVQRISVSPDGRFAFTSDETQPRLAVIDTAALRVKTWVPLPATGYGSAPTPDGKWLLVAVPSAKKVTVINLQNLQVVRNIDVPSAPQEVLVRPDGKVAYVSCNTSGQVAAIDLTQWKVEKLIPTGKLADGLGWAK
jgi:DNA-binding beta-propeller fold protein YncE